MTISVGSVGCTFVHGPGGEGNSGTSLRQRVQSWFVPGVAGQFARKMGLNEAEFSFTAVQYDTLANVEAWRVSIEALQGTVVTITDDFGKAWANCFIATLSICRKSPATGAGGSITTRGEIQVRGLVMT